MSITPCHILWVYSESRIHYNRAQREAWSATEWRPCDWIRLCVKKLSCRRILSVAEWNHLAEKLARRACPWAWAQVARSVCFYSHAFGIWRGRLLFLPTEREMDLAVAEARRDGRQFCDPRAHRDLELVRLYRREREVDEVRHVLNKLKRVIRDERKHQNHIPEDSK